MTRVIALIGHPVSHSVSPTFQQAALDAAGVDGRYEAWDTPEEELPANIERLRSGDLMGANITVPHKVASMRLVDEYDALAERAGAINTIVNRDGRLHATNTDVTGILHALRDGGAKIEGAHAMLFGAGGAARAAVAALREDGAARVTIANRSEDAARELIPLGGDELVIDVVALDADDEAMRLAMSEASIVIQATSLGMTDGPDEDASPAPADLFRPGQIAFDIVYTPMKTPFVRDAEAAGAQVVLGVEMLVHLGAECFRLWTGQDAPLDVMRKAALDALDAKA